VLSVVLLFLEEVSPESSDLLVLFSGHHLFLVDLLDQPFRRGEHQRGGLPLGVQEVVGGPVQESVFGVQHGLLHKREVMCLDRVQAVFQLAIHVLVQ